MQSEYANRLLYIATLAFAKLSIISLLMILTAADLHRTFGIALTVLISVWGVVGEFVAAFQCGAREPWRFTGAGSKCVSIVSAIHMFVVCMLEAVYGDTLLIRCASVGSILESNGRYQHVDRSRSHRFPRACYHHATDVTGQEDHNPRLLWGTITVRADPFSLHLLFWIAFLTRVIPAIL